MIVTPSFILIGRNFGAGKARAMSWMTVGACLGGIAYPPLVAQGLQNLDYTTTMLCLASSCLIYVVASTGYIEYPGDKEGSKNTADLETRKCDLGENSADRIEDKQCFEGDGVTDGVHNESNIKNLENNCSIIETNVVDKPREEDKDVEIDQANGEKEEGKEDKYCNWDCCQELKQSIY